MFGKLLKSLFTNKSKMKPVARAVRYAHRHHRRAVADGLRLGSSHSGKVMAGWRWKGKK